MSVWTTTRGQDEMNVFRAIVFIAASIGMGSLASAQAPATVRIVTLASDSGAQVFYAQDLGFFAQAGLQAQIDIMTPGAIPPALASGTYDIAEINIVSLAQAVERGQPFVLIAPSALYNDKEQPTDGNVVAGDSNIKRARDFNGKTFAVNGLGNIGQAAVANWIDKDGGDSTTVKWIDMSFPLMITAIEAHRIDGGEIPQPALDDALAHGEKSLGTGFASVAHTFEIGGWTSTRDFATNNPETVRRFAAVMARAARWANTHHAESAAILEKWSKLKVLPTTPRVPYGETLDSKVIQPLIDVAARYHILPRSMPGEQLISTVVLKK